MQFVSRAMKVRKRINLLADVFLAMLHSDGPLSPLEQRFLGELLSELLITPELPSELKTQINTFDPKAFDLQIFAADYLSDPPMKPRRLLELCSKLAERDGLDLREDEFLRALARVLGMPHAEYSDLVLDYEWVDRTSLMPEDPQFAASAQRPS